MQVFTFWGSGPAPFFCRILITPKECAREALPERQSSQCVSKLSNGTLHHQAILEFTFLSNSAHASSCQKRVTFEALSCFKPNYRSTACSLQEITSQPCPRPASTACSFLEITSRHPYLQRQQLAGDHISPCPITWMRCWATLPDP